MIYLDAGATTLQKPHAVALAVQSAMCRMATPGRGLPLSGRGAV